jgi:hypothetical protein
LTTSRFAPPPFRDGAKNGLPSPWGVQAPACDKTRSSSLRCRPRPSFFVSVFLLRSLDPFLGLLASPSSRVSDLPDFPDFTSARTALYPRVTPHR